MSQLIIRGTKITKINGFVSANGQMTYEFVCRASWSDVVCKAMCWTEEPIGFGTGALDGKLHGISMILEPSSKNLKDYRFDLSISQVGKFKHIAKIEDGEVSGRELEFAVTTVAEDAHIVLDNYLRHCGPGDDRGQARITFNAEAQQKLEEQPEGEIEEKARGRKAKSAEAVQ